MTGRSETLTAATPTVATDLRPLLRSDGAALTAMFVALGVYYLIPGNIAAVIGAALFFALAVYKPHLTPAVIAATVSVFYRSRQIGPYLFPLAEFTLFASLGGWVVHDGIRLVRGRIASVAATPGVGAMQGALVMRAWIALNAAIQRPFAWSAVAFLLAGAVSLVMPPLIDRAPALREFRWTIIEPILYFVLIARFVRTQDDIFRTLNAFLVAAAVNGQVGVTQYMFGQTWSMEGVGRAIGLYPGATAFGIFMGRALSICATLALFLPATEERWRRWRIAYFLMAVPIGLGMIFSFARGAWIGVFVALAAIALLAGARRILLLLVGGAAVAVPVFLVIGVERLVSLFTLSEGTNQSRLVIWQAALRVVRDHPIWGIGQDQFLQQPASYGIPNTRFQTVNHPHDWILDTWLRLGLFGLLAMAATILVYLVSGVRAFLRNKGTVLGALTLALLAGMVDHAAHGLVDQAYFVQDLALTFWLMLGLMAALIRITPSKTPAAQDAPTLS